MNHLGLFRSSIPRLAVLLALSLTAHAEAAGSLEQTFNNPPEEAKPHTWWHWCGGNVSKEGITLDLEAMRRIGVGGAQIFNVAPGGPIGSVETGSQEWRDLTKFAITEANRIGLEIAIHNCPGWSESGGPWVKPEQSMQKVVFTETNVEGPRQFAEALAQPETVKGFYRDIAVLAFPTLSSDENLLAQKKAVITSSAPVGPETTLTNSTSKGVVEFQVGVSLPQPFVQMELPTPSEVASLSLTTRRDYFPMTGKLEASDDGNTFRKLAEFSVPNSFIDEQTQVTFPKATARYFRMTFSATNSDKVGKMWISRMNVGGPRINDTRCKAGYHAIVAVEFSKDLFPPSDCIAPERIINLTDKVDADGKLTWKVPEGSWTIVRFGHTSNGKEISPVPESVRGLECDKMSRAAVEAHFKGMMGKVIADVGPLAGKTLKTVLIDSWEVDCQNWTPAMREEFKVRRGYDLTPWLVALTSRAVGSVEQTERFLWDFRCTIGDLIAENHYGVFQELCHKNGMLLAAEAPGIGMPTIANQLQCKAFTDVPMGEFWMGGRNDAKEPACAAHIYGKKLAAAEAFTAETKDAKWTKTPFDHKAIGDLNFCRGINRFVFHRFAMQPWTDRFPGMSLGPWGTNFDRTNTWWEQAGPWMKYITRCQALLQTGLFSADVLYFYGEGSPATLSDGQVRLPKGYDFDACDAGALLARVKVKDGRLVLPDGMSYRVLMLPATAWMTPAVLQRIKELAEAGATVIGTRFEKSPSLTDWPKCDEKVRELGEELWGKSPEKVGSRAIGKGRIIWGKTIPDIFAEISLKPDFESNAEAGSVAYIHRNAGDADFYFVSNQTSADARVQCTFRVNGKVPELWHPDTGIVEAAAEFSQKDGCTIVPVRFEPAGSVFVVFRKPATPAVDSAVAATRDGKSILDPDPSDGGLVIEKALYGANPEQGNACADVTSKLIGLIRNGRLVTKVNSSLVSDPATNLPKRLLIKYAVGNEQFTTVYDENTVVKLPQNPAPPLAAAELARDKTGALAVNAPLPGVYEVKTTAGKTLQTTIPEVPKPLEVGGKWELSFPPKWGAPEKVSLEKLISWTDHSNDGVKHFSGTATYSNEFNWSAKGNPPGTRFLLDLGLVKELAQVKLNGKDLGVLWKPPFVVDVTEALRSGKNVLEVRITNLWPNRMIGDAPLPQEKRVTWTSFDAFKPGDPLLTSGLLGPVKVHAIVQSVLK